MIANVLLPIYPFSVDDSVCPLACPFISVLMIANVLLPIYPFSVDDSVCPLACASISVLMIALLSLTSILFQIYCDNTCRAI